ncbi:MAG: DNA gyrase subunit A [Chloroflexi bacterium]|nr:DNA gyrase subunit A [Anaerolineaceae bacterium]NMD27200.1 DNA gyrase subunit A [Chloroflexota bacterium]
MDSTSIKKININTEMQQSYLDYAMSVIVSRALPDARDGLKPVQRRILYAMYDMGVRPDQPHKKSARIVGEVLGKYHPHGDSAVYEAMARMAQDFSERYPLVDGQGNFGSIDGDPPAAMRYTEARLSEAAVEILKQFDMDTVEFTENFDGSLEEPLVLPSALPNMLVNGASGIAVGMATNIPPHNLGEVINALVLMLENWEKIDDISTEEIMRFIKGPDFPTGGLILQEETTDTLAQIYGSGNGVIQIRARTRLEEMSRGRMRIIVTELPYMVNKSALIEKIAEITRDGVLEGITDLRDESDRQGMRIVIDLNKNADPEKVLSVLYKKTAMHSTFAINILALVDGSPHRLSLKQSLRVFAEHRLEVIRRRSEYELRKNEERLHILEALRVAIKNIDLVIQIIRKSKSAEEARQNLMSKLNLDEIQATAILDLQLRRLASLERQKIEDEYQQVSETIKNLKTLLRSPQKMRQVEIDELKALKAKYADPRRTQIIRLGEGEKVSELLTQTDVMPLEHFWIEASADGMLSRTDGDKPNRLGGENAPWNMLRANSHQTVFLVTTEGKAAAIHSLAIPVQKNGEQGIPAHKLSPLVEEDVLQGVFSVPMDRENLSEAFVLSVSRQGMVKRSALQELPGASANSFVLTRINDEDELFQVLLTNGKQDILLTTASGMSIRFNETEIRPMGLIAAGVNGIKLKAGDYVVGASLVNEKDSVALITRKGLAKRVPAADYPLQGRYGQGVISWKLAKDDQIVVQTAGKLSDKVICHFRKSASKVFAITTAVERTRLANGQAVFSLKAGDELIGATALDDLSAYWERP